MLTLEDGNSTMLNGNKLCCKIKKSHKVAGREAYKRVIRDVSNYAKCTFGEQVYYGNKKSPGRMWNIFMRETPYHDPELTYPVIKNFDNGYKKIVRTDVGVWLKDWIRGENLKLHQEPTSNKKTCWEGPGNRDPWWLVVFFKNLARIYTNFLIVQPVNLTSMLQGCFRPFYNQNTFAKKNVYWFNKTVLYLA